MGARIRRAREERDIAREDLAARIRTATGGRTSTNTLGRWESTGRLTIGELRLVASLLEIDVWDLLTDPAPAHRADEELRAGMYVGLVRAAYRLAAPGITPRDRTRYQEEFDLCADWLHLSGDEAAQIVESILHEAEAAADEAGAPQDDELGEDDAPPSESA